MLYPQLMYKPQNRELIINKDEIVTTIGKISGSVKWNEIQNIITEKDKVIIRGEGVNSFLIPNYAFISPEQRIEFITAINEWRKE